MSSPVVAVKAAITNPELGFFSQPVPKETQLVYRLLSHIEDRSVAGNKEDGVYIQVDHVKYQNPEIARSFELVGRDVRIFVSRRDSRLARAYVKGAGTDLGLLFARGSWGKVLISWRHRKLLQKAGASPRGWQNDPVRQWRNDMASKAAGQRRNGKKTGGAEALLLAQLSQNELRLQKPNRGFDASSEAVFSGAAPSEPSVPSESAVAEPEQPRETRGVVQATDTRKADQVEAAENTTAPSEGAVAPRPKKARNTEQLAPATADASTDSSADSSVAPQVAAQPDQKARTDQQSPDAKEDEDIEMSQAQVPGASLGLYRVPGGR
jgi:hypothetical protein